MLDPPPEGGVRPDRGDRVQDEAARRARRRDRQPQGAMVLYHIMLYYVM